MAGMGQRQRGGGFSPACLSFMQGVWVLFILEDGGRQEWSLFVSQTGNGWNKAMLCSKWMEVFEQ